MNLERERKKILHRMRRRIQIDGSNKVTHINYIHYIINFNSFNPKKHYLDLKRQEYKKGLDFYTSLFVRMKIQDIYNKPMNRNLMSSFGYITVLKDGKYISQFSGYDDLPF